MRYYSDVDSNTGATGAFNWNDTVGSATNSYAQGNFLGNSGITSTTYNQLSSGSPAVNRGIPVSGISVDYNGKSRVYGSAPDIGAVEYQP